MRDYRGERYTPRPTDLMTPVEPPLATEGPRLFGAMGEDETPTTEPLPFVTIDRLVQLSLEPGVKKTVHVALHAACAGTMANLAQRQSCVDDDGKLEPIQNEPLEASLCRRPSHLSSTPIDPQERQGV